jgi:uncharacterized protein (TIGR03089 family)
MPTPPDVLAAMLSADPGRPRVTYYDDTPGPTAGERIELSAKVLANWVNKAANALQEEWDLGPGSRVRFALPSHWRTLYWALATWSVGATVTLDSGPADLVLTDDGSLPTDGAPLVLVTLAALARAASPTAPPGVMDEAAELATYADQFSPWDAPDAGQVALEVDGARWTFEEVVSTPGWPAGTRLHSGTDDVSRLLLDALAVWGVDGSLVLSRGPAPSGGRESRLSAEGVTLER